MINKVIKTNDIGLVAFFNPDYIILSEVSYMNKRDKVIYIGAMKDKIKNYLEANTASYISLVGAAEKDFSKKESWLRWVLTNKGWDLQIDVQERFLGLDDGHFYRELKHYWLTGKITFENADKITFYDLFKSTLQPLSEMLKIYYNLIDNNNIAIVEASFLTFLSRVYRWEEQAVSPGYLRLLNQAFSKYGDRIKAAVTKYFKQSSYDKNMRLIRLFMDLR